MTIFRIMVEKVLTVRVFAVVDSATLVKDRLRQALGSITSTVDRVGQLSTTQLCMSLADQVGRHSTQQDTTALRMRR